MCHHPKTTSSVFSWRLSERRSIYNYRGGLRGKVEDKCTCFVILEKQGKVKSHCTISGNKRLISRRRSGEINR